MNMGLEKAPFFLHPKFKHLTFKNCILIRQGDKVFTIKKFSCCMTELPWRTIMLDIQLLVEHCVDNIF